MPRLFKKLSNPGLFALCSDLFRPRNGEGVLHCAGLPTVDQPVNLMQQVTPEGWQSFVAKRQRLGVSSPKLVCIDILPYGSTQASERDDILNIGGFSDAVFHVVASYLSDDANRFVAEVGSVGV